MTPLAGKTVVVTRSEADADPLCVRLRDLGAHVVQVPSVRIVPLPLGAAHHAALAALPRTQWLVCVSRHGAQHFAAMLQAPLPEALQLAAVGPGTAAVMAQLWRAPDLLADPPTGEGLAACLVRTGKRGHVLLPTGLQGRRGVHDTLVGAGFTVDQLAVYENHIATAQDPQVELPARVDFILFTSPSTVTGFLARQTLPPQAQVITIGPTTTEAVQKRGLAVGQQAPTPSIDGLVQAVLMPHRSMP